MEEKKTKTTKLQYLRDYKFNTKFYKAFSKSIRAKLHAVDRDTFIKFCAAIGMIVYIRDKDGEFDYLELELYEDLGKLADFTGYEDGQRKPIIYSFDDGATVFYREKLSDFEDQDQLKRFYLDLFESLISSLY